MNVLKIALLGTAALAAVSVSARADDLADLKAQIEALNGRISQLESTPSTRNMARRPPTSAFFQQLTYQHRPTFNGLASSALALLPRAAVRLRRRLCWQLA
jgi:hypothetical protein